MNEDLGSVAGSLRDSALPRHSQAGSATPSDAARQLRLMRVDQQAAARKAQRTRESDAWKALAAKVYQDDINALDLAIAYLEADAEARVVKEMQHANAQRNLAAGFWTALRKIAYLRPGGPTGNKLIMQMESIALEALAKAEEGSRTSSASDGEASKRESARATETSTPNTGAGQ